jgi:hypothetical protein
MSVSETPQVIITELQASGVSASEEFIELHNTTNTDIDLADSTNGGKNVWKLQLFSSTATTNGNPDWTKPSVTITLTGVIPALGYYVVAGTGYVPGGIDSDQSYSPRLSDTGGGLQLLVASASAVMVHDRLMWKKVAPGQALPTGVYGTPEAGSSLQRQPTDEDTYFDENSALLPFILSSTPTPKDIWQLEIPLEPETPEMPNDTDGNETPPADDDETPEVSTPEAPIIDNAGLLPPQITELLPNPASPNLDESDEYIELYNPNDAVFELKGYTIETGTSTLHDFTFIESFTLPPHSYTAFYSRDTRLTLANTSGQARLFSPEGTVISETDMYASAAEGTAWTFMNGTWQWSASPTPDLANIITAPLTKKAVASVKKAVVKPAKKAAVKTASAKKVKGAITKKAKAKKAPKPKVATVAHTAEETPETPIHTGILVAVVGLAVLYAAYEYRGDISNRLYKLRHNRAVRFFSRR